MANVHNLPGAFAGAQVYSGFALKRTVAVLLDRSRRSRCRWPPSLLIILKVVVDS